MKLIAFYLPQFHQTPENDTFWGEGFTEWTNVKKTKPLIDGHHQPRLPTELGFYDLNNDSVRHKQARLAQQYGINAWCYYYYRFDGKRVLEMPFNRHFEDKSLSMSFLICWANENWTRAWDGLTKNVLIKQNHSFEDDLNFIKEVAPMLADPRYIKIDNKPVLLIYRPELWENIKETVSIWREYMKSEYGLQIYLIRPLAFEQSINPTNPNLIGFNAAYQFPPFGFDSRHFKANENKYGALGDYRTWRNFVNTNLGFKLFRGVMTGFDNSPRRKGKNVGILLKNTPKEYEEWLKAAIQYTKQNFQKEEQLIFINAWNEWGEGAILEPCNFWERKYLKATLNACNNYSL